MDPSVPLIVMVLYLLLLFGIAQFAERRKLEGKSIVSNPYVYALSWCVYVTAWTFYGSIGRAATTGLEFLPIYLGPTLAMLLGWLLIRKMVRASKEFRLTSVSDFMSYRYGRSYTIGAIVAIFSLIIVTPYVALQLIAISTSLEILIDGPEILLGVPVESKLLVAILLGAFAVIFGARHLDPMEHHEGLIGVIAFESLVKLVAFLMAGVYVAYGIFGGYGSIFEKMSSLIAKDPNFIELVDINYTAWFSLMLISFFAVLLLPRQFHVMAVENTNEEHLKKAMWLFPLYLLLINIFVPAIAWAGTILGTPGLEDAYIITIPHMRGLDLLALFFFIGGTSAATAMILMESVAVGTMILNDLEMPYLLSRIGAGRNLPNLLLNMRRMNILLVVLLGYLYSLAVAYQNLADIGIISFLAVTQFAPIALGGLYWRRGCREGAIAGLFSGFILWAYTAFIPALAGEGSILNSIVENGPSGLALLKPTNLFGLNLDHWTNSLLWTLLFNCSLYVLVSLLYKPSPNEEVLANSFVDVFKEKAEPALTKIIRMGTVEELETTLALYIGGDKAKELVEENLARLNTTRNEIDAKQLLELWKQFEKTLTSSVGSSATRMIVEETVSVEPVIEAVEKTLPVYSVQAGKIYVVPEKAYEVFTDQITHGVEGLCITQLDPDDVRRTWGFKETPVIRLSDEKGSDRYISPRNLPLLFMTLRSFVETSRNSIILIDNIEYLDEKNAKVVPEREILDFVHQIELLGHKTRILLAEKKDFVRLSFFQDINEIKEIIFTLGPFSAYLFKVFSETMLSRLSDPVKEEVVDEVNALIISGSFFPGAEQALEEDAASCEPEMGSAIGARLLNFDSGLILTRREFFLAIRRLARIIKIHDPGFDLMVPVGDLMKSYGWSPYELSLTPGTTYVIETEAPTTSLNLFYELITHGMEGLCISRYNPETLQDKYNIPENTIIWLTQKSEPGFRTVDPTNLPRLSSMISDFLNSTNYPLILLEGIGYLITQSNYETVLRFIQSQRDEVSLLNGMMLVHIDPLSLDIKELHRLKSEMEPLKI